MLHVYLDEIDGSWFGLVFEGEEIVATTVDSARESALKGLLKNIPFGVEYRIIDKGSKFAERTINMLRQLESGNEELKMFSLATNYVSESIGNVLKVAAAIPLGYVASYGDIAKVSGTTPRAVGQIMATNPLYPIVPCHRVVGTDFSLVGYGGGKSRSALQAKFARLNKEAKGFITKKDLTIDGRKLPVYPVENVLSKASKHGLDGSYQRRL